MKIKLLGLASILCTGFSMQAANTLYMTFNSSGAIADGSAYISPYTGMLSINGATAQSVNLYCDDANDAAAPNNTTYNVNITTLAANGGFFQTNGGTAVAGDTRYGLGNTTGATSIVTSSTAGYSSLPSGTSLYDALAWLFTQMLTVTNSTELKGLQEAAWDLTSNNSGLQNNNNLAEEWLKLARTDASGSTSVTFGSGSDQGTWNLTYTAATYNDWEIITDTISGGYNSGSGYQEFLAYTGPSGNGGNGATPEPATFGLFGSALLLGAMVARRRRASK